MFFKKEPAQEIVEKVEEPEESVYSFRYQICPRRHSVMEYISRRGSLEEANAARAEVLTSLSVAMKDKSPALLFDSIGIQGEWLAWFYVGAVKETTDSNDGKTS